MTALTSRSASLWGWVPLLGAMLLIGLDGDPVLLHVATLIAIWSIWGSSFNIVWGYGGQFSMAQIALGAMGAYAVAVLSNDIGWNFWLALLAAIVIVVAMSVVIGAVALRLSGFYFAIMTLAFASLLLRVGSTWDRVGKTTGIAAGSDAGTLDIGGVSWDLASKQGGLLVLAVLALSLTLLAVGRLERTRTGRALMAVREDQTLAASLGVRPVHYRLVAFASSAVIAAIAGVLYGMYLKFISPSFFGTGVLIILIVQVVIGGIGHRFGPVLGAAIYISMTEYFNWGGEHSAALFGIVLILMTLIAPTGILGRISLLLHSRRHGHGTLPEPAGDVTRSHPNLAEDALQ